MNYFDHYRAGHELFLAYWSLIEGKGDAQDAQTCARYDVQPWDADAAERVDEIIADDHAADKADYAHKQRRELVLL